MQVAQDPTVADVVRNALGHLHAKYNPDLTQEQREKSARNLESVRNHYGTSWYGDTTGRLSSLAGRLDSTIQFIENRRAYEQAVRERGAKTVAQELVGQYPAIREAFTPDTGSPFEARVYHGLDAHGRQVSPFDESQRDILNELGVLPNERAKDATRVLNDPELVVGEDDSFLSGIAGMFSEERGFPLTKAMHDSPSRLNAPEFLRNYEILYGEDDETGQVELTTGERVNIPALRRGNVVGATLADGTEMSWTVTNDFLKDLASRKAGGALGASITGHFVYGDEKVNTTYGERLLPKFTGNKLIDRELYARPEWQRAVEQAEKRSAFGTLALQAGVNIAEFAATMLLTRGAVKGGAALGRPVMHRAGAAMGRGKGIGRLAAVTGKAMGRAATGGGRAGRLAAPGTNFDLTQIGEEVWYEAVRGMATGEGDPGDWLRDGVSEGVAEYWLGRTARGGRALWSSAIKSGALDRAAKVFIHPKNRPAGELSDWAKRFDEADTALIQAGTKKLNAGRSAVASATDEQLEKLAKDGMFGAMRAQMAREFYGQMFDTAFVGYAFGSWQGGQVIATEEGKRWDSLTFGEKAGYIARGAGTEHAVASMVGMAGFQAGWAGQLMARKGVEGVLTADQKEVIDHLSAYVAWRAELDMRDPEIGASLDALFMGATTSGGREAAIDIFLTEHREDPDRGDPRAGDIGARLSGQSGRSLVQFYQRGDGDLKLDAMIQQASEEDLSYVEATLRVQDPGDSIDDARAAGALLAMVKAERKHREQHGFQPPLPPGAEQVLSAEDIAEDEAIQAEEDRELGEPRRKARPAAREIASEDFAAEFDERVEHLPVEEGETRQARRVFKLRGRDYHVSEEVDPGTGEVVWVATSKTQELGRLPHAEGLGLQGAMRIALEQAGVLLTPTDAKGRDATKKPSKLAELVGRAALQTVRDVERVAQERRKHSVETMADGLEVLQAIVGQRAEEQATREKARAKTVKRLEQIGRDAKTAAELTLRYVELGKKRGAAVLEGWLQRAKDPAKRAALEAAIKDPDVQKVQPASKGKKAPGKPAAARAEPTPRDARPPTAKQLAHAQRQIGLALQEVAPFAQLEDEGAIFDAFVVGSETGSIAALRERVREAKDLKAKIRASVPKARKLSKPKKAAAEPVPVPTVEQAAQLWDSERQPHFKAGWNVFNPTGGEDDSSRKLSGFNTFSIAVMDAALTALEIGATEGEARAMAESKRDALVAGMIVGLGGLPTKGGEVSLDLISAISFASPNDVRRVADQLVLAGSNLDGHIREVLEAAVDSEGRQLIKTTAGRRIRSDTLAVLRLAALGAPATVRKAAGRVLAADYSERIEGWFDKGGLEAFKQRLVELRPGRDPADTEGTARAIWTQQLALIKEALRKSAKQGGVKVADLSERLRLKISRSEAKVPSAAEAAERLMLELSGRAPVVAERSAAARTRMFDTDVEDTTEALEVEPDEVDAYLGAAALNRRLVEGLTTLYSDRELGERELVDMARRLADRDPEMQADAMLAGMEQAEFEELADDANQVSAYAQHAMRVRWKEKGLPEEGYDALLAGIEARAHGRDLDAADAKLLGGLNLLEDDGKLRFGIEHMLMSQLQLDMAKANEKAEDGSVMLYGGLPVQAGMLVAAAFNWASGYYDRYQSYSKTVHHEVISARGHLSVNKLLEWFAKDPDMAWWGTKAGKKLGRQLFGKGVLPWWQRYVGRGKSGWASPSVRDANKATQLSRVDGEVLANDFVNHMRSLGQRWAAMKLQGYEAELIGRVLEAGGAMRFDNKAEWEAFAGKGTGYLFDIMLEANNMLVELGRAMVRENLIDSQAYAKLENRYLPRKFMRWAMSTQGVALRHEHSQDSGPKAASSEFERDYSDVTDEALRTFDIRYLMPLATAKASQRLRLFRTLGSMLDRGAIISADTYDKLTPFEQGQFLRTADRGKEGRNPETGKLVAVPTEEEQAALDENEITLGELNATLAQRERTTLEQAQLFELIAAERKMRSFEGGPAMTPGMESLLDRLESGYTTRNTSIEISVLLDATELGSGEGRSRLADGIQQLTLEWRRLRTIQNPKHWMLQLVTNWATNAATGKVPMGDMITSMLFGEGTYAEAAEDAVDWQKWIDDDRPESGRTAGVERFDQVQRIIGGNTFERMIFEPVRASDVLQSMVRDAAGRMRPEAQELQRQWSGSEVADDGRSGTAMRTFAHALGKAGRGFMAFDESYSKATGAANPVGQAEAKRALMGIYNLHEVWWKYAAYLEGVKRGLTHEDAAEWAQEGTGDYSDRNPWVYRMSTVFTSSVSDLHLRARERIGKGKPGFGYHLARLGLASPFWQYRWSMWPTLGAAAVNHPHKAAAAMATVTVLIKALGNAFEDSGEDEDQLIEALSGREGLLHQGLSDESMGALVDRYGDSPSGFYGTTVREWGAYWKAWSKLNPLGSMLTTAKGPTLGGQSTYFSLADFAMLPAGATAIANKVAHFNDRRPRSTHSSGIEELGVGFLTGLAMASGVRLLEAQRGVKGATTGETWARIIADVLAEGSAPMGGGAFPSLMSRELQAAQRTFIWDGRSLSEIWNELPNSKLVDSGGKKALTAIARTVLPLRTVSSQSVRPQEQEELRKAALRFVGFDPRAEEAADRTDRQRDVRNTLVRRAVLNLMSRAYKEHLDTSQPIDSIYARMFSMQGDLVLDGGGNAVDVTDAPRSELGRFVRSQSSSSDERGQLLWDLGEAIKLHKPDILRLVGGAQGLVYKRDVDPAVHDRILRAAWNNAESPDQLLRFLHERMHDPKDGHPGVWRRLWFQLRMPQRASEAQDKTRYKQAARWVDQHSADASADVSLREAVGPQIYDVMPQQAIQSLRRKPKLPPPASGATRYPYLMGSKRP